MLVPVSTLVVAGVDEQRLLPIETGRGTTDLHFEPFMEPIFPMLIVTDDMPIPAASFACAAVQKEFIFYYLVCMHERLPGLSERRASWQGHVGQQRYDRHTLVEASVKAQQEALVHMRSVHHPVMGATLGPAPPYPDPVHRNTRTGAYMPDGTVMNIIPPCGCTYCDSSGNIPRFPEEAPDGPFPGY